MSWSSKVILFSYPHFLVNQIGHAQSLAPIKKEGEWKDEAQIRPESDKEKVPAVAATTVANGGHPGCLAQARGYCSSVPDFTRANIITASF